MIGEPIVALLAGVFFAMWALGKRAGFDRKETSAVIGGSLPPVAGILLIVAAGGGFKQVLSTRAWATWSPTPPRRPT